MVPGHIEAFRTRGEIGGRTAQIVQGGGVECHAYEPAELPDGWVRIRTVRSALSPGTERTFYGTNASNVYLHRHWNEELRIFEPGEPSFPYPILFGYRAAGEVIASRSDAAPMGMRVFGNWLHTELIAMPAEEARAQVLPDELSWDDGVDVGQMAPICLNAIACAEGEHAGTPVVVFGAGPVGLITAMAVKADGADHVLVVDRIGSRLAIAAAFGLEPVDASAVDVAATIKRRVGPDAVAVAIECTGSNEALHQAIRTVRRRGLVVAAGFYQGEATGLRLGDEFHHNGIRVVGAQIGNLHPTVTWASLWARAIEMCATGQVPFGRLPRLAVPIDEVASGMAAVARPRDVLQVVLTFDA